MAALREALRAASYDFQGNKIIASIIGDHIADEIRAFGLYEGDQLRILRDHFLDLDRCRTAAAVDVGANIGNHTLFFSDLFKQVVAFEPNPVARVLLDLNLKLNGVANVDVRCEGLSDHHGTAVLTSKVGNLGATRAIDTGQAPDDSLAARELVELVVGDDVLTSTDPVGLIKIDVEGGEFEVLKGLERTIASHRPVIMMEQLGAAIDATTGQSPSVEFLTRQGYAIFEIRMGWHRRRSFWDGLLARVGRKVEHRTLPVSKLEKRDYPTLVFVPTSAD